MLLREGPASPTPRGSKWFGASSPNVSSSEGRVTEARFHDARRQGRFPRLRDRTSGGSPFHRGRSRRAGPAWVWPRPSALATPSSTSPIGAQLIDECGETFSSPRVSSSLGQQRPRDSEWAGSQRPGVPGIQRALLAPRGE